MQKNSFGVRKFDEEGRVVMTDHQTFVLFNVYFPNAGRGEERLKYKLEFYEWFRKLCLDLVQNQQRNVIIVGDVNTAHKEIDVHRPDSSATGFLPEERQWIDEFLASGFIDIFRYLHPTTIAYSWWDPKSSKRIEDKGWRLDYAFVNSKFVHEVVECVYLKNVFGSDHCPLILTLKSKPQLGPHSSPELSSDNLRKVTTSRDLFEKETDCKYLKRFSNALQRPQRQGKIRSFFEKPNNASTNSVHIFIAILIKVKSRKCT
jgi:exodeoxyribonuclease-3